MRGNKKNKGINKKNLPSVGCHAHIRNHVLSCSLAVNLQTEMAGLMKDGFGALRASPLKHCTATINQGLVLHFADFQGLEPLLLLCFYNCFYPHTECAWYGQLALFIFFVTAGLCLIYQRLESSEIV